MRVSRMNLVVKRWSKMRQLQEATRSGNIEKFNRIFVDPSFEDETDLDERGRREYHIFERALDNIKSCACQTVFLKLVASDAVSKEPQSFHLFNHEDAARQAETLGTLGLFDCGSILAHNVSLMALASDGVPVNNPYARSFISTCQRYAAGVALDVGIAAITLPDEMKALIYADARKLSDELKSDFINMINKSKVKVECNA